MEPAVKAEAAILIAYSAYRPFGTETVLHLNLCVLSCGNIGRKGDEQVTGHTLLDGDNRPRRLVSGLLQLRINRELRNAQQLFVPGW